jgi:hypothetical protein
MVKWRVLIALLPSGRGRVFLGSLQSPLKDPADERSGAARLAI